MADSTAADATAAPEAKARVDVTKMTRPEITTLFNDSVDKSSQYGKAGERRQGERLTMRVTKDEVMTAAAIVSGVQKGNVEARADRHLPTVKALVAFVGAVNQPEYKLQPGGGTPKATGEFKNADAGLDYMVKSFGDGNQDRRIHLSVEKLKETAAGMTDSDLRTNVQSFRTMQANSIQRETAARGRSVSKGAGAER